MVRFNYVCTDISGYSYVIHLQVDLLSTEALVNIHLQVYSELVCLYVCLFIMEVLLWFLI